MHILVTALNRYLNNIYSHHIGIGGDPVIFNFFEGVEEWHEFFKETHT